VEYHRAFWSAVVLRACHDIQREPLGSAHYEAAVAFFTAPGDWAESRRSIADCINLHPDDLARAGVRQIAIRRLAEGLPEFAPPVVPVVRKRWVKPARPPSLPRLQAIPKRNPTVHGGRVQWAYNRATGRWVHANGAA
jgi:hypothetical protein